MKSPQKNSTINLKEQLRTIVDNTNKYNLSPSIKKVDGLYEYVMTETSHFPSDRNLSFRAKSIAFGVDCKCLNCENIVKIWGKKFCSNKCYSEYKATSVKILTSQQISERIPNIINIDNRTAECSLQLPNSEVFCDVFNRVYNLTLEELETLTNFSTDGDNILARKSNKINLMLSFLIKIAAYQGITEDLFDKCLAVENFEKKTENIDYYELLYGVDEAEYRLGIKSERMKGDKNPAFQHDGLLSPFSKKFIKGDVKEETIKKAHESREANNGYQTRLEYWTERYGDEEGKKLYYERQRTFSKDTLIEKHGEEKGIRLWEERQVKWLNSLEKLPVSKKIEIRSKQGFWRYADPHTDRMQYEGRGKDELTTFYVIEYSPLKSNETYIKIGVTNRNITSRFPLVTIKNVIIEHKSSRYVNFHIERDVKKYIFEKSLNILMESEHDKFDGWTECVDMFNKDIILEVVNEAIERNTKEV